MNENPVGSGLIAVFDSPTEETCGLNYAEGARCGRPQRHKGLCSQVSRWVTIEQRQTRQTWQKRMPKTSCVRVCQESDLPSVEIIGVLRTPEIMRKAAAELLKLADWLAEKPVEGPVKR